MVVHEGSFDDSQGDGRGGEAGSEVHEEISFRPWEHAGGVHHERLCSHDGCCNSRQPQHGQDTRMWTHPKRLQYGGYGCTLEGIPWNNMGYYCVIVRVGVP